MTEGCGKGFKHGLRYKPEYRIWICIKQRCLNPNRKDWQYYGGRGITVCDEWVNDVRQFIADIGERPSKAHQLDRRDNDKGYSKENCHWVLKHPQMQNTRISKKWIVNGVLYNSLSEAAKAHKVTISRIKAWCEGRNDGGYSYPPKENCWSRKVYE